jgi:hypothetical protein
VNGGRRKKEWLNLSKAGFKETYLLFVSLLREKNLTYLGKNIQNQCTNRFILLL